MYGSKPSVFLCGDLDQDQLSTICLDQGASKEPMNLSGHGFIGFSDALYDPDLGSLDPDPVKWNPGLDCHICVTFVAL